MDSLYTAWRGVGPRVLLVYTQRYVYGRTFESVGNLGLLTLAAELERHGFEPRVFTGITTDVMREAEAAGDGLFAMCFYCDFENQSAVAALCRSIRKKYGFLLLIGGPQTLHMNADSYKVFDADVILFGDGEKSLPEFLKQRLGGNVSRSLPEAMLPGDSRPGSFTLLEDFSSYAFPDDRLALHPPRRNGLLTVITARGCPHRCAFCFEGGNSKVLRCRPPDQVLEELELRLEKSRGARYVFFADDTFTVSAKRLESLLDGLRRLRKRYDFVWFCEGHALFFARHPEMMRAMIDAGMVRMQIGMESADDRVLKAYGKGITARHVLDAVNLAQSCGLPQLCGNYIIGGAYETSDSLRETTGFVLSMLDAAPGMPDISTTFVIPLPGTRITTAPDEFDIIMEDPEYLTSNEDWPPNSTRGLSQAEICTARSDFVRAVSSKMLDQFDRGVIPSWRIRGDFELAEKYGLVSAWLRFVYSRRPEVAAYYMSLIRAGGTLLEWDELPEDERARFVPKRTVSWKQMDAVSLDGNERELLRSAGRANLGAVAAAAGRGVPEILRTARSLAKKYLLLFSPAQ